MKWNRTNDMVRLRALTSYGLLDTMPEKIYDDITRLAASICKTEFGLITLLTDKKQFFKSHHGINFNETSIETSFCRQMISDNIDELIVEDAKKDARFKENPSVVSQPGISFYAGVSLTSPNGVRLGALCVMHPRPKILTIQQKQALHTLAQQVVQLFELRKITREKQEQESIGQSKDRLLNTIVNSTKIGIWDWEKTSDRIQLSEEGGKIVGYEPKELEQLTKADWNKRIHPDDIGIVQEKLDSGLSKKNEVYSIPYRMFHKNGQVLWIRETGKVSSWSDAECPLAIQGIISDITQKVNHDKELEKLKNNQEALINGTQDLLWSVDTEYKFIIANDPFEEIMQKTLHRKIYEGDSALPQEFPEEINKKWKSYYDRAMGGEQFSVKERIQVPSEALSTYGLISFNPMYDRKGTLLGISCSSKDITAEVASKQAIIIEKDKTEKIINTSLDIICTVDKEGYFLTINKACKRIWGYKGKELIGKKYTDFVYSEDVKASEKAEQQVAAGQKVSFFENRYVHKDKRLIPMLWSATWDNEEKTMYCIARDIAEKKIAEQQLEHSERRFKTLVQEGSEMIAILDKNANYIYVSPTSTKMLNITPETFVGTNAFDYIHPADHAMIQAKFMEILNEKQVRVQPYRFKNMQGEWRWLETIATDQSKEPSINGIVANTRDVTDRMLYLKAIEEQNTALKEVAWNQSHIVRAPVARLLGLINLIKEDGLKDDERAEILAFIASSAEEIDFVIKKNVEITTSIIDIDRNK